MFKKRSYRKTSRRPYQKRAAGGKRRSVSAGVKKYVKTQIHRNIENKCVQINGGYNFGNINESTDFSPYPMAPLNLFWTIPQSISQGGRIGNQIRVRKVLFNYILRPTGYDAVSNPLPQPSEIQLLFGHVKPTPSTIPTPSDVQQIFQSGSGVAAPVGSLRDIISVVNKDYWVIKKRITHKIGFSSNSGTGGNANVAFNANNDFKMNVKKTINITKMLPKTITFNDGGNSTTTKNLFMMTNAVAAMGGVYSATNLPANIEFWIDFHYEDA